MTIKLLKLLIIGIILIPVNSFANGGPVDISHFRKTGNIRLLRKADISLVKESLKIKIIGDYTEIEVDYNLKKQGRPSKNPIRLSC